jgi:N-acetylmuramoyl-L-alanine amidase
VISRGDTLSTIAQRHRVSLPILKQVNGLSSDRIRIGQKLRIPSPEG